MADEAHDLNNSQNEDQEADEGLTKEEEGKCWEAFSAFDKDGSGRASPILRIGDNDVLASHSASIGRLNEEHLFYLESRGLSHEEAKRLITLGYLKPIEDYFSDSNIKNRIDMAIEGGI